jgi:hypothetical protein
MAAADKEQLLEDIERLKRELKPVYEDDKQKVSRTKHRGLFLYGPVSYFLVSTWHLM